MSRFYRQAIAWVFLLFAGIAMAADGGPEQSGWTADLSPHHDLISAARPFAELSGGAALAESEATPPGDEPIIDTLILEELTDDLMDMLEPGNRKPDSTVPPDPNALSDPNAPADPNTPPDPQAVPMATYPAQPTARYAPESRFVAEPTVALFGREWTADLLGTAAFGDSQGELYTAALSLETLIWDKWSLVLQPFGGIGQGDGDTTGVFGFDHLLKYPLFTSGAMKFNFEGGGGVQQAGPRSWPDEAPHFTARGILGAGIEWNTAQYQRLLFGARWLHVSDTFLSDDEKVHVDSLMLYGGFQMRF
ncbi:MAG: hypothetical protein IH624_13310 [Phycisphaerae bacterium]|nr:hypothetical protein [Phycisphaerae bacterium]